MATTSELIKELSEYIGSFQVDDLFVSNQENWELWEKMANN